MKNATIAFKNGNDKYFSNSFTEEQAVALVNALTALKNGVANASKVYYDTTVQLFIDLDYVTAVTFEDVL